MCGGGGGFLWLRQQIRVIILEYHHGLGFDCSVDKFKRSCNIFVITDKSDYDSTDLLKLNASS